MPDRYNDRQARKFAGAEKAAADRRVQEINEVRAALIKAWAPTDPDDQPPPPRSA